MLYLSNAPLNTSLLCISQKTAEFHKKGDRLKIWYE